MSSKKREPQKLKWTMDTKVHINSNDNRYNEITESHDSRQGNETESADNALNNRAFSQDEVIILSQAARNLVGMSADLSEKQLSRPRAAWSDDEQQLPQLAGCVAFDSTAARSLGDTDAHLKQLLSQLEQHIETSKQQAVQWSELRQQAEKYAMEQSQQLEQTASEIETMLIKCVEKAKKDVETQTAGRIQQLNSCIKATQENLRAMNKLYRKYSSGTAVLNVTQPDKLDAVIARVSRRCKCITHPLPWQPSRYAATPTADVQMKMIEAAVGLHVDNERQQSADDGLFNAQSEPSDHSHSLPSQLLVVPKLMQVISCRWKKDKRACGITDVALTDSGQLFVVDQHNKTVKVFNLQESGAKLIQVLGRDVLQKPSRVSYIATDNQIIVTDDATHKLRLFNASDFTAAGTVRPPTGQEQFRYPVGCCVTEHGHMYVAVDFDTKSIVYWHKGSQQVNVLETQLECPAYIAITRAGYIAVTDWKASCLKLFDITSGCEAPQQFQLAATATAGNGDISSAGNVDSSNAGSASGQYADSGVTQALPEPHGVCADVNGLVFVADRRSRTIQIFSEHTAQSALHSYTDQQHKLGVPFAVSCNSHGLLAVADYVGTVRIYSYWDSKLQ